MTRRLVVLGSSITALALARDGAAHGLEVHLIDRTAGLAFGSRRARAWLVADDDEAMAGALRLAGAGAVLAATSDGWLRFLIARRAALERAYSQVLHPSNAMLETFLRKDAFASWCEFHGLPTPPSWVPGRAERPPRLDFPMLLRPCETLHDNAPPDIPKAVEVRSNAELSRWLARFRAAGVTPLASASLLRQRLTQYSVPFARHGCATLSFVARKLRPDARRCAQGSLVEWCPGRESAPIERLALRVAECADYHGIGEVEILHSHDSGRSYVVEVNARPWMQYALAPATGHDLLGLMLGLPSRGRVPGRGPRRWINLRDDRSHWRAAAAHGIGSLARCLASAARGNVYAVFDPRDPLPLLQRLRRG